MILADVDWFPYKNSESGSSPKQTESTFFGTGLGCGVTREPWSFSGISIRRELSAWQAEVNRTMINKNEGINFDFKTMGSCLLPLLSYAGRIGSALGEFSSF